MSGSKRSASTKGSAKPKVKFSQPKASSSKGNSNRTSTKGKGKNFKPRQQSQVMPLPRPASLGASYNRFLKQQYQQEHGKWPTNAELEKDYPTYKRLLSAPVMGAGMLAGSADRAARSNKPPPALEKSIEAPVEYKARAKPQRPKTAPPKPTTGPVTQHNRTRAEKLTRERSELDFATGYIKRFKSAPTSGYSNKHVLGTVAHKAAQTIKAAEVGYKYSGPPNRSFTETAHVRTGGVAPEMKEQHFGAAPAALYREIPKPHLSEVHTHSSGNAMTWTACERLTTQVLNTTFNTQGAQLLKLIGNPTMTQADRMKVGAQMFDNYEFTHCKLMWSSSCGVTQQGRILGGYDPDTSDASGFGEDALTKLASHEGASTTHVFNDHHWVMPAGSRRMCWTKYSASDDSDVRQTDQFNFFALVSATITGSTPTIPAGTAAPAEIGEWYVEYTIHYFNQTMESQLLGNAMISYNTSSLNLVQTVASNESIPRFSSSPVIGADYSEITSTITADVIMGGPLATSVAWRYISNGWFPCVPSAPFRITVRAYWSDADATGNRGFSLAVLNPDDTSSIGYFAFQTTGAAVQTGTASYTNMRGELFPNMSHGEALGNGNNLHWCQIQETGITNAFSVLASYIVDPSAFRYNPSRVAFYVIVNGTTLSTAVLGDLHIDVEMLSVDLCSAYGVPALDPQGNLINNIRCLPTRNSVDADMQRRVKMGPDEFREYQMEQVARRRRRRRITEDISDDEGLGLEKRRRRRRAEKDIPMHGALNKGDIEREGKRYVPYLKDAAGKTIAWTLDRPDTPEPEDPPGKGDQKESKSDTKAGKPASEEKAAVDKTAVAAAVVVSTSATEDGVLLDTLTHDEVTEILDKRRRRLQSNKPG